MKVINTLTPRQIKEYKQTIFKCLKTDPKGITNKYPDMTHAEIKRDEKNSRIVSTVMKRLLQNYGIKENYVGHDFIMYLENLFKNYIYAYIDFDFKLHWLTGSRISQNKRKIIKYYYQIYLIINGKKKLNDYY